MKKISKLLILFACTTFAFTFWGCKHDSDSEDDTTSYEEEKTTETADSTEATETTTLTNNATLQALITNATAGSTVNLTSTSGAGTYIAINKALTVDGKNISGLTVYVLPSVSSNVKLKNFKKATVKIATPVDSARTAFTIRRADKASASTTEDHLKKMGEDALPLYLEGCEIEKFEASADVALHLENGDKKSEIGELKLKEGVEDFTFVEMDKADSPETTANEKTPTANKTKVDAFIIEKGVEKVNLIGGTFDDVSLADDFSGKIDFKYDKEFDDQLNFSGKDTFLGSSKIDAKDVAIADNNETSLSGVWKMEINKEDLEYLNGYVSIVFLNEEQIKILTRQAPYDDKSLPLVTYNDILFTAENPIYCLTCAGDFQYDSNSTESLRTLCGSEPTIWTVSGYNEVGEPIFAQYDFDNYPNYRKESVIVKVTDDKVIYYVNLDEIKKSDLLIGAISETGAIGAPGSKLSSVDLAGYKPYFAFDFGKFGDVWNSSEAVAISQTEVSVDAQAMNGYEIWADGVKKDDGTWATVGTVEQKNHITTEALASSNAMAMDGTPFYIPVYDTVQFAHGMPRFFFFDMEDASAENYPDVSNVKESEIAVETE